MSNEQFHWKSVTHYIDGETGEIIDKSNIQDYTKAKCIDKVVKYDKETWTKSMVRTVIVTKIKIKQLELWK